MTRLRRLLEQHEGGRVLVIGEYLTQVEAIAKQINAPLVTGKTPQAEREQIYERFRRNELHCIVLSKVGNFASTFRTPTCSSRCRACSVRARRRHSASVASCGPRATAAPRTSSPSFRATTREEEFAHHRKLFLTEQGYSYQVVIADTE